jgi:[acyl-carrier-protein] S-malonyltransferase
VVVNTSAQPVRQADQIRRALLAQVTSAVLWEQSIRVMYEMGTRRFVEIGPGTTLSGMIRKTVPVVPCHVEDVASRDEALNVIFGQQVR